MRKAKNDFFFIRALNMNRLATICLYRRRNSYSFFSSMHGKGWREEKWIVLTHGKVRKVLWATLYVW